jgi:hypothetical protein
MRASVVIGVLLLACWCVLATAPARGADSKTPDLPDSPLGDISNLPSGLQEGQSAADAPADIPGPADVPAKKSSAKASGKLPPKDPVALAFQLPKNVQLNDKQQKALDELKGKYASDLRATLDEVAQAKGGAAQATALKKVKDLRAKIKTGLTEILAIQVAEAQKKARDAYNRQQEAWRRSGGPEQLRRMQDQMRRQQDEARRRQQDALRRQQEAARRAKR